MTPYKTTPWVHIMQDPNPEIDRYYVYLPALDPEAPWGVVQLGAPFDRPEAAERFAAEVDAYMEELFRKRMQVGAVTISFPDYAVKDLRRALGNLEYAERVVRENRFAGGDNNPSGVRDLLGHAAYHLVRLLKPLTWQPVDQ